LYFFQPNKVEVENWLLASNNESDLQKQLLEKYNLELEKWFAADAQYNSSVSVWQWFITYRLPYPLFVQSFVNTDLPISEWVKNINMPFVSAIKEGNWTWAYDTKDLLLTSEYWFINDSINNIDPQNLKEINEDDLEKLSLAKLIIDWNSKIAFIPNVYLFTLWWQESLIQNLTFVSNLADYLW
jgi:hypothetical protein